MTDRKRCREQENEDVNTCLNSDGSLAYYGKKRKTAYANSTAANETVRSNHAKKGIGTKTE